MKRGRKDLWGVKTNKEIFRVGEFLLQYLVTVAKLFY